MKLSKNKITKLLRNKKQTRRRYKKSKNNNKHKQKNKKKPKQYSFRKLKQINIHNKTLKRNKHLHRRKKQNNKKNKLRTRRRRFRGGSSIDENKDFHTIKQLIQDRSSLADATHAQQRYISDLLRSKQDQPTDNDIRNYMKKNILPSGEVENTIGIHGAMDSTARNAETDAANRQRTRRRRKRSIKTTRNLNNPSSSNPYKWLNWNSGTSPSPSRANNNDNQTGIELSTVSSNTASSNTASSNTSSSKTASSSTSDNTMEDSSTANNVLSSTRSPSVVESSSNINDLLPDVNMPQGNNSRFVPTPPPSDSIPHHIDGTTSSTSSINNVNNSTGAANTDGANTDGANIDDTSVRVVSSTDATNNQADNSGASVHVDGSEDATNNQVDNTPPISGEMSNTVSSINDSSGDKTQSAVDTNKDNQISTTSHSDQGHDEGSPLQNITLSLNKSQLDKLREQIATPVTSANAALKTFTNQIETARPLVSADVRVSTPTNVDIAAHTARQQVQSQADAAAARYTNR